MTIRGVLRWLKENGITTTASRVRYAHERGLVPWPDKNDAGDYTYSEFDRLRLKAYFEDRVARPGKWLNKP